MLLYMCLIIGVAVYRLLRIWCYGSGVVDMRVYTWCCKRAVVHMIMRICCCIEVVVYMSMYIC